MDAWLPPRTVIPWQVELQFYGSERTTQSNWEYAKELGRAIPSARFMDGSRSSADTGADLEIDDALPLEHAAQHHAGRAGPRYLVDAEPLRAESERVGRNAYRLFSLIGRSGEAIFKQRLRGRIETARDAELFPNAIQTGQLVSVRFHHGNGFGLGRGDTSPEGKKQAAAKPARVLAENAKVGYGIRASDAAR
jgi:hypothetical protein